jgi:hypothetical protein
MVGPHVDAAKCNSSILYGEMFVPNRTTYTNEAQNKALINRRAS